MTNATIDDVKQFWDRNPLMSLELGAQPGTREFFLAHNKIRAEVEKFSYDFWQFDRWTNGQKVLDIGCGPGWLVRQFASHGTDITGVDLSPRTVSIAKQGLQIFGLQAQVLEGNAERLPFYDNTFDYVTSAGVLHHTPDTAQAFAEVRRVLKPGGVASIALYYKNPIVLSAMFPVARLAMNMIGTSLPGRAKMMQASSVEEFVRMYDGENNPVGKAYNVKEAKELAKDFQWLGHEIHYFPRRFIPGCDKLPLSLERLLDNMLGTMIFFRIKKPSRSKD